jgi:hypothetical protein
LNKITDADSRRCFSMFFTAENNSSHPIAAMLAIHFLCFNGFVAIEHCKNGVCPDTFFWEINFLI